MFNRINEFCRGVTISSLESIKSQGKFNDKNAFTIVSYKTSELLSEECKKDALAAGSEILDRMMAEIKDVSQKGGKIQSYTLNTGAILCKGNSIIER